MYRSWLPAISQTIEKTSNENYTEQQKNILSYLLNFFRCFRLSFGCWIQICYPFSPITSIFFIFNFYFFAKYSFIEIIDWPFIGYFKPHSISKWCFVELLTYIVHTYVLQPVNYKYCIIFGLFWTNFIHFLSAIKLQPNLLLSTLFRICDRKRYEWF